MSIPVIRLDEIDLTTLVLEKSQRKSERVNGTLRVYIVHTFEFKFEGEEQEPGVKLLVRNILDEISPTEFKPVVLDDSWAWQEFSNSSQEDVSLTKELLHYLEQFLMFCVNPQNTQLMKLAVMPIENVANILLLDEEELQQIFVENPDIKLFARCKVMHLAVILELKPILPMGKPGLPFPKVEYVLYLDESEEHYFLLDIENGIYKMGTRNSARFLPVRKI